MFRLKALPFTFLLFASAFSLSASSDNCSPTAAAKSLSNGLWEVIQIENPKTPKEENPNKYADLTIRLYENLADHLVVPHCRDCKSLAEKHTETVIEELSRDSQWNDYWKKLSPEDKLMDILLPVIARVSSSRNSTYYDFLVKHINEITGSYSQSDSCQHLKSLSQSSSSEPPIGWRGGLFITIVTVGLISCFHF
ncbi:MAG: hypothetical protein ACR2PX_11090 [Endozoicomonas sp.]|uniref:hypothetical protein n=1 Tax=Endozoicomonas sp. TaxID=1892382 RepID=UPI003D9BD59B